MAKVFISYRRADSASISGRIYDRLVAQLGRANVFKDVDDIPPGVNFGAYIQDSLRQCAVALVIIGPRWLDVQAADGERRLDDAQDWVRIEIETARSLGLTIIPLLVEGARMPKAAELPDSLQELAQINSVVVRNDPDFVRDMERVIAAIQRVFATRPTPAGAPAPLLQRGGAAPPQAPTPPGPAGYRPSLGWIAAPLPADGGSGRPGVSVAAPARQAGAKPNRAPWLIGSSLTVVLALVLAIVIFYRPVPGGYMTSHYFGSVAMVSPTDGWAVGDTIRHYSGGRWTPVSSPASAELSSVAMVSATDGWAVGESGTILHYSGEQWTR